MPDSSGAECPSCGSTSQDFRNPLGNHAGEGEDPEYEWCEDPWHKPEEG